jgi:hypothetical protein
MRTCAAATLMPEVVSMQTDPNTVFVLWCRLTGTAIAEFTNQERREFLARPQVAELAATPYEILLDAGVETARHGTLPLERWVNIIRTVRPLGV